MIAAAAISMLLVQMDWFALNLMLPVIADDFATPTTDLQWLVSGYMLALGALMITGGRAADLFGRRRVLVTGLVGFAVVAVAVASTVLELLSGSVDGAAADGSAIESVLRVAALLALLGAAALGVLVRRVKV